MSSSAEDSAGEQSPVPDLVNRFFHASDSSKYSSHETYLPAVGRVVSTVLAEVVNRALTVRLWLCGQHESGLSHR